MVGSGLSCGFFARVVASFIRCLVVLAHSRWFLAILNSSGGFGMVVAGLIWLLKVL